MSVTEATTLAWAWATFMYDGCLPPDTDDVVAVARIDGFGVGRFGPARWGEIRRSVKRYPFHEPRPNDVPAPLRFTWDDLMRVVKANNPVEEGTSANDA